MEHHQHGPAAEPDEAAMAELLDLDAEVLHCYLSEVTGWIVAEGTPEQVASAAESRTGQFLRAKLADESRHWARAA